MSIKNKMEKILVYDNFLKESEINRVMSIINDKSWSWGHVSNKMETLTITPFWSIDLSEDEFFTSYLKKIFEDHFSKKFKLKRVYANGQTYGQDGTYHIDDENSLSTTVCLYITKIDPELVDSAGGYIYLKIPDKKYNLCYEPLFNRIIAFPSNYLHKGTSYSRYFTDMRICVAWKLIEII